MFEIIAWGWFTVGMGFVLNLLLHPPAVLVNMETPSGVKVQYRSIVVSMLIIVLVWPLILVDKLLKKTSA